MKSRESRKLDHIRYALCIGDGPCASGFSDVHLLHHCLSGICRDEVELTCFLPGLPALTHPIIINAITGAQTRSQKLMNPCCRCPRNGFNHGSGFSIWCGADGISS